MSDTKLTAPVRVAAPRPPARPDEPDRRPGGEVAFTARDVRFFYGAHQALRDVNMDIPALEVTALIGPSGCGKSTLLRCFNRMNDDIRGARLEGSITYRGVDLYGPNVEATAVRRAIGMVFQRPNPFPKSIYDNVAFGLRAAGRRRDLDTAVEHALRRVGLWSEVANKLKSSALGLSGGQQQRLCIARALAVQPDVLLMDEPCSALDPIATLRIEELITELRSDYTIVIVTHNLQQAARISDRTAFFTAEATTAGARTGILVEEGPTGQIFGNPRDERTDDYVAGRFG